MKNLVLLTTVLIVGASPCFADEEKKIPATLQLKYERRLEDMKRLDKNKDGVLQVEELQGSVDRKFDAADINEDGVISEQEKEAALNTFKSTREKTYGDVVDKKAKRLENRYERADANKDGKISEQEYDAYFGGRYENFDRNGDGIISKKEYRTDVEKLPRSYMND